MEMRFDRFPYNITLAMFSSYFVSVSIGTETLDDDSQLPKKA